MGGVINCFYVLSVRSTSLPQHPPFPASASTWRNRLKEARLGFHGVVSSLFTLICFRLVLLPPRTLLGASSPHLSLSHLPLSFSVFLVRGIFCGNYIILYHATQIIFWSEHFARDDTYSIHNQMYETFIRDIRFLYNLKKTQIYNFKFIHSLERNRDYTML